MSLLMNTLKPWQKFLVDTSIKEKATVRFRIHVTMHIILKMVNGTNIHLNKLILMKMVLCMSTMKLMSQLQQI